MDINVKTVVILFVLRLLNCTCLSYKTALYCKQFYVVQSANNVGMIERSTWVFIKAINPRVETKMVEAQVVFNGLIPSVGSRPTTLRIKIDVSPLVLTPCPSGLSLGINHWDEPWGIIPRVYPQG